MNENEAYQALLQMIPDLQKRIREEVSQQYEHQLRTMHQNYVSTINQMKQEFDRQLNIENQLRKQLSLIQRERQTWNQMERQYQVTIREMTKMNKQKQELSNNKEKFQSNQKVQSSSKFLSLLNNSRQTISQQSKISKWKKSIKLFEKDIENPPSLVSDPTSTVSAIYAASQDNTSVFQQYTEPEEQQQKESRRQARPAAERLLTSVLSPPRSQQMKRSVLEPPDVNVTPRQSEKCSSSRAIFWEGDNKKKLMAMIKGIK